MFSRPLRDRNGPSQEAERLAKLPRMDAVDGLAQIIAATPASRSSLLDGEGYRVTASSSAARTRRRPLRCLIGAARD